MKLASLLLFLLSSITGITQTLIHNVNVVDVENQKILPNQNVMIANGRFTTFNKNARTPPDQYDLVDGQGKYLMPGLVDAHIHFFQSGGIYTRPDGLDLRKYVPYSKEIDWTHRNMEDILRRYTANGITTVIDVGSTINFLRQRDTFQGKWYAPEIYMTGPLLTTYEPRAFEGLGNDEPFYKMNTVEDARNYVRKQLPYKPDFIKIWYIVQGKNTDSSARSSLPLVQAVIDEAHRNHLRVAVHATEQITARLAVEAGADFLVHNIENEAVSADFVQLLKQHHTVLCPTMVVAHNYDKVFSMQYPISKQEWNMANPIALGSIQDLAFIPDTSLIRRLRQATPFLREEARKTDSILFINFKKLLDGGVTIATGTDAGNIGTQHVSSYFDEVREMQKAGASMWQLIQASTINGARALGKDSSFGSIKVGKVADAILLTANPLESLDNWNKIDVVINKGNFISKADILHVIPEHLAQDQLNAYNAHDLDAFLTPYADDVMIYDFPEKLIMRGKEEMRKQYAFVTRTPKLHCNLLNRIVQGNTVIDQEEVFGFGPKPVYGIAVYIIEKGKISKVYFMQ